MNKQEAIEIIEQSKIKIANRGRTIFKAGEIIRECVQVDYVPLEVVVNTIDQIHEPQKVVVPAFIDSFIRYAKAEGMSLFIAMDNAQNKESEWIIMNEETFARAWLDGYEIEQEKLYTVEIPDPNSYNNYRFLSRNDNGICIDASNHISWKWKRKNQLTESEIKKDFEWAWQFAKEVE